MKKFVKKLQKEGVKISRATSPEALYLTLEIPVAILTPEEKGEDRYWVGRTRPVEANGLLYPRQKHWEVFRNVAWRERLVALLRKTAPKGWREYRPPSFSDICKNPENLGGLYGPPPDA